MRSLKELAEKLKRMSDQKAMKDFMLVFGEPMEPLDPETAAELEAMLDAKRKELKEKSNTN